jgi:hypothetical protein
VETATVQHHGKRQGAFSERPRPCNSLLLIIIINYWLITCC